MRAASASPASSASEGEVGERVRDALCVVQAPVDGEALFEQLPGACLIAAHQREPGE